jgi:ribosomal protein S17E
MKKLKLHSIVLAIVVSTVNMQIHGMGQSYQESLSTLFTNTVKILSTVTTDAAIGLNNRISGYTDPFLEEIANHSVDSAPIKRNHRYEHAINECIKANNPEKLLLLMTRVDQHNKQYPQLKISMSQECQDMTKKPLEELYKQKHAAILADAETHMSAMIKRWTLEHQELTALNEVQRAHIETISHCIGSINGNKPNDTSLTQELQKLLIIRRYNFPEIVARDNSTTTQESTVTDSDDDDDDNDNADDNEDHEKPTATTISQSAANTNKPSTSSSAKKSSKKGKK